MRRKIPYRVCRCMPDGVVTHLEARLLREIVNREIHPIRCAESCKVKYKRGMRIGDLCAETDYLFAEKYDGYYDEPIGAWEDMLEQYKAEQETARIFSKGQGDYFPRMET